jgi:hypothetical protein
VTAVGAVQNAMREFNFEVHHWALLRLVQRAAA